MSKIAVVTDSNSGITQERAKELGIYVLPMPFFIDGELYLEDITLTQEQFYEKLRADSDISTSQPSPGNVMELWESVLKEYDEIAAVNKKNGDFHSADEFLSGFKKTDRLHPVISLCVYYGESEWDGPFSLKDMLEIPEKIEPLVSDYHNACRRYAGQHWHICERHNIGNSSDYNRIFGVVPVYHLEQPAKSKGAGAYRIRRPGNAGDELGKVPGCSAARYSIGLAENLYFDFTRYL